MRSSLALLFAATVLVSACTPPPAPPNPEEIRQQYVAFNVAFAGDDVDAVMAFYEDGALRLPPDGSAMVADAALADTMRAFRDRNAYVLDDYSDPEVLAAGDLAVSYSTFREHWVSLASGDTTHQAGRWIIVWRRQADGSWKVNKEMWTADLSD